MYIYRFIDICSNRFTVGWFSGFRVELVAASPGEEIGGAQGDCAQFHQDS